MSEGVQTFERLESKLEIGHTGPKPYLSPEVCPPQKMSVDHCYMMTKDAQNVNGNPGD